MTQKAATRLSDMARFPYQSRIQASKSDNIRERALFSFNYCSSSVIPGKINAHGFRLSKNPRQVFTGGCPEQATAMGMKAADSQAPGSGAALFTPALAAGRSVPWWGVLSVAAGFGFLVGGWTMATALQPASFNWLASTVSPLTERAAADPWVTTAAFAVT